MPLPTLAQARPQPKIAAAAVATLAVWALQAVAGIEVPIGIEGAIATLVGYLMPNDTGADWSGPLTEGDE